MITHPDKVLFDLQRGEAEVDLLDDARGAVERRDGVAAVGAA